MAEMIRTIGVLGAGTMGAGIAQVAATSGFDVQLCDIAEDVLETARSQISYFLQRAVEKGRMQKNDADAAIEHVSTTTDMKDLSNCDFIIEAVPEKLDLKIRVMRDLATITSPHTVLATNTSTLSITRIAGATDSPERVVGMHFFNPAPLMPLVEVVAGAETLQEFVQAAVDLVHSMGKEPVLARDVPGYIVNLVARPFYLEPMHLLEMGVVDHETADALMVDLGFRMGPFRLMDLIGMDVNYASSKSVYDAYYQAARLKPSLLQQRKVEAGHLGRKSGQGWYHYEENGE